MAGAPGGPIETARLVLRAPEPGDAPALAAGIGNYDILRWLGRLPYPYRLSDAEAFIAAAPPGRTWLMFEKGALIGGIGTDGELGYWLARGAWGRGLATEACDAVVDAWFADPRAPTLVSSHLRDNDRSARVLVKQGFRYTGTQEIESRALGQIVPSRTMELTRAAWADRRRYRLVTPRLTIRGLREGDLPALMRIAGRPEVARMLFNITLPWPEPDARGWLWSARFRGRLGFRAAITRRGRLIGVVGIGRRIASPTVSTMYFVDPAHWGRGYATEALVHFLTDTMARFGVSTVWADHFDDNPASGAVLRRAGFRATGTDIGTSAARDAPAPVTVYRLDRADLPAP